MGWCHEFGPQIQDGCSHPMVAGATACSCERCGAVCTGRFNGCAAVWARGPLADAPRLPAPVRLEPAVDAVLGETVSAETVLAETVRSVRSTAEPLRMPDFTIRAEPVRPLARSVPPPFTPPPAPPPEPPPEPVTPWRRARRPHLAIAPHAAGLSELRAQLDGLRGELSSLDNALGRRTRSVPDRSGDSG